MHLDNHNSLSFNFNFHIFNSLLQIYFIFTSFDTFRIKYYMHSQFAIAINSTVKEELKKSKLFRFTCHTQQNILN